MSIHNYLGKPVPGHQLHCQKTCFLNSVKTYSQFKTTAPCPVNTSPCRKSFSIFLIGPFYILKCWNTISPQSSFLQAEEPQLSQPFLIEEVLQIPYHFHVPSLDSFQEVHVLMFGVLVLEAGGVSWEKEERATSFQLLSTVLFDAAWDIVGFLDCKCTLSDYIHFATHQYCQIFLYRAALNPLINKYHHLYWSRCRI